MKQIVNGKILADDRQWIEGGSILINNGKIERIMHDSIPVPGVGRIFKRCGADINRL